MSLNFNEVTNPDQCALYFANLSQLSGLSDAAELTKAYRNKFGTAYAQGFVIDIATIRDLIKQNGGNISGIRVYMGFDNATQTSAAVAVATVDPLYTDFAIPILKSDPCNSVLGEGRPCPYQCGMSNALNQ